MPDEELQLSNVPAELEAPGEQRAARLPCQARLIAAIGISSGPGVVPLSDHDRDVLLAGRLLQQLVEYKVESNTPFTQ